MLAGINSTKAQRFVDVQGHRGCRGILPENTIEGFIKALEVGVTTLEMDVVISKDKQVVVSHEPYFSHEISTAPSGEIITRKSEKQYNIYRFNYDEIKQYDVGMKTHSRFPRQKKIPAFKPLLKDVIALSEEYAENNSLKKPHYNIEIKRKPEMDSIFHPSVEEFVQLVVSQVNDSNISDRACIQSFDIESLQRVKKIAPELTTALLIENNNSLEDNLKRLGFTPNIYSPYYRLVSQDLVNSCKEKGMRVIPWTVNKEKDMIEMIELNVDGIITDYPQELIVLLDELKIGIK